MPPHEQGALNLPYLADRATNEHPRFGSPAPQACQQSPSTRACADRDDHFEALSPPAIRHPIQPNLRAIMPTIRRPLTVPSLTLSPFKSLPRYRVGPFTAEMSPTAAVKRAGAFSQPLFMGLLVQLPDPDGVGAQELDHAAYQRQLVELTARSASHLTVPRPVVFDIHDCPEVVGIGLFDGDGVCEGYGALRSSRISPQRPDHFEFPSHQIMVKRPPRG